MKILPNGQVEIENFDTGERKVVRPEELPNYGVSIDAYNETKSVMPGGTTEIANKQKELDYKRDLANPIRTTQQIADDDFKSWQKQEEYKAKTSKLTEIYKDTQLQNKQKTTFQALFDQLNSLKTQAKNTGILNVPGSLLGADPSLKNFEMAKALAAQQIAKLAEYGKTTGGRGISDKDREFYQKLVSGIKAIGLQGPIESQVESLKKSIATLAGYKVEDFKTPTLPDIGASTVVMTGPDGKKYNVPSNKVDAFKKAGGH